MDRHPSTMQIMRWFEYKDLPEGPIREVARRYSLLATDMMLSFPDGPELVTGLRKLLESKECMTRVAIDSISKNKE